MGEVSVTFKAHGGFDAPWVVVKGASVPETSAMIEELRQLGAFSAIKQIAEEFKAAPTSDEAEAAVKAAFPNARGFPTPGLAASSASPATSQAAAPATQTPPSQSVPPCETCGAPAKFKSGTSSKGAYQGYACQSDRTHFTHVK